MARKLLILASREPIPDRLLEHREGLGLLVPAPGLEHLDQRFPRMFRALKPIDSRLARWAPTSTMGDHVLSVWRYRGS